MSDLIGKRLGQYEILEAIGQGGMAAVYKAHQESIDREVAIKVIIGQLADNADFITRFEREARLIAKLQHPHSLPVYDFGRDGNMLYLVMRYVDGGSLDQRLRNGPLPLAQTARMFADIASALTYAHERGIIHRDLKPNNILLDSADNPYLTDFGIAKILAEQNNLTATGAVMGTPSYMAPEQWRGENVDARTDIYALGVMLYEMLTGSLPFKGDTPFALMFKHFDSTPQLPSEIIPNLPVEVGYVINKAMAKQQQDRYSSAVEMANDLTAALIGTPTLAAAVPKTELLPAFKGGSEAAAPTRVARNTPAPMGGTADNKTRNPAITAGLRLPTAPPERGRFPLLIAVGVLIILLVGAGAYFANQAANNARQLAIVQATQTQSAMLGATGTALALLPTVTSTPTATPTATQTAAPSLTPTVVLPTSVHFADYTDTALNIKFPYPSGWEIKKQDNNALFVTQRFADLKFGADGIITGPPFIQIVVGNSDAFGSQDMATAKTPMDALVAFLGDQRIGNLDPVYGTHFPTATTTRPRPEIGAIRVLYLTMLGPDQFALVLLHTSPALSDQYKNSIALPLVRALNFAMTPTAVPQVTNTVTPTAAATFVMPQKFTTYESTLGYSINYPSGWLSSETGGNFIAAASPNTDPNSADSPPYISIVKKHQSEILYHAEYSIADLYRDNLGSMSINPTTLDAMPYPTAIGRSLGRGKLKINGWLALVELDDNDFLIIYAQAPRGAELEFSAKVLVPMLKSIKVIPGAK